MVGAIGWFEKDEILKQKKVLVARSQEKTTQEERRIF